MKKLVAGRAAALAKIEKPKALEWLGDILDISDALMVARGDLGVELPARGSSRQAETHHARRAQSGQARGCRDPDAGIDDHRAGADARGSLRRGDRRVRGRRCRDAVGGIGSGPIPVEAVAMMDRSRPRWRAIRFIVGIIDSQRNAPEATTADAIMAAVHEITHTIHARAIVCWTKSGSTALRAARERSDAPIIVLTPTLETARRLSLVWGLHCVYTDDAHDLDDMVDRAARFAFQEGFAKPGERIVVTAGVPLGTPGATNMLRVAFVGEQKG